MQDCGMVKTSSENVFELLEIMLYIHKPFSRTSLFLFSFENNTTSDWIIQSCLTNQKFKVKGGYLDFSNLTELKNIFITEIYMKRQCQSSIIKNHKTIKIRIFDGVPLKSYVAS